MVDSTEMAVSIDAPTTSNCTFLPYRTSIFKVSMSKESKSHGLTEESAGLLVRSDSTRHEFQPSRKSLLGLDKLAAQKRAEQGVDHTCTRF